MGVIEILSEEHFIQITSHPSKENVYCIYLYATWAEPCEVMSIVYNAISDQPKFCGFLFLAIDTDRLPSIVEHFEIDSVPFFIFVKGSVIINETSTAYPRGFVGILNEVADELDDRKNQLETTKREDDSTYEDSIEDNEQLYERLNKLTNAAPVMLFLKGTPSEPQCGFSKQIVSLLRGNNLRFGFFDVLKDDSVRIGLKQYSDWPTFPQLYINGQFQGGLEIIKESLQDDPYYFLKAIR